MPASNFDALILQKLGMTAREFMDIMAQRVNANNLPKAINDHTSATSPIKDGNKYSVDVVIDTSENAAPMAGAYEYGSGEYGEKGEKYRIEPKNPDSVLAFPKERTFLLQQVGRGLAPLQSDMYFFKYVEHPGVAARPFIAPSINVIRERMKKTFAEGMKGAYLSGVPKVTVISAKK